MRPKYLGAVYVIPGCVGAHHAMCADMSLGKVRFSTLVVIRLIAATVLVNKILLLGLVWQVAIYLVSSYRLEAV